MSKECRNRRFVYGVHDAIFTPIQGTFQACYHARAGSGAALASEAVAEALAAVTAACMRSPAQISS